MDKLETLHLILKWAPQLTKHNHCKAAHILMFRIGEYCADAEEAWLKFGWLLRRITITQAFEISKHMWDTYDSRNEYPWVNHWAHHYACLSNSLGGWEHAHYKHVALFWRDEEVDYFGPSFDEEDD